MSQLQNPPEVLESLEEPTAILGSDDGHLEFEPFSIREYVLGSREKDIFQSWPFPEKYLNMFRNHGIETVLPPFESHHSAIQSLSGHSKRSSKSRPVKDVAVSDPKTRHSTEASLSKWDENVSEICNPNGRSSPSDKTDKYEEVNDCRCKTHPYDRAVYSRRRQNTSEAKRTKRYIADILNATKVCDLQNPQRVQRLRRGLRKYADNGEKLNGKLITKCESKLTKSQFLSKKFGSDDCEGAALDMVGNKRWALRVNFRGRCSKNSRTRNLRGKGLKVFHQHQ